MSKYSKVQMKSFFDDVTRYVEDVYDKQLVLNTSIGPALAVAFKTVDDCTDFIITVVNDKAEETDVRVTTETCIEYARKDPAFTDGMPEGKLADKIAFTGLALALLDVGVTPIGYTAVRNAVLKKVLPLVSPVEPEEEKNPAQALRSILLELLKDLEEAK